MRQKLIILTDGITGRQPVITRQKLLSFAIVASLSLCVVACGGSSPTKAVVADGLDLLPHSTLEDWVTYSDAVVVVNVNRETEIAPSVDEIKAGEGMIMRTVQVEVSDTVWSRDEAPSAPATFEFVTYGWVFKGDKRTVIGEAGGARIEVGRSYLVPLVRFETGEWAPISSQEVLVWNDGVGVLENPATASAAVKAVADHPKSELADLLGSTKPDPVAAPYGDLSAQDRYQAVANANRKSD